MNRCCGARAHLVVLITMLTYLAALETFRSTMATVKSEDPQRKDKSESLDARFSSQLKPFVDRYCISCHGPKKQAASLDLSRDLTMAGIIKNDKQWEIVLERLHANEMPPEES